MVSKASSASRVRDVTRERGLVRAKDELVSIASHELRGPLSNISGFADLLLMQHRGNERATEDQGTELHFTLPAADPGERR